MRIIHISVVAILLLASDQGFAQPHQGCAQTHQGCAQTYQPSCHSGHSQWWHNFWHEFETHRRRVNAWPHPFVMEERELVREPFRMMADNGWKLQNTLSDHLFTPEEHELTYAGQLKLRWILTQIPPHRRQIYVMEAIRRKDTATRVASVYENISEISPYAACPVFITQLGPRAGDGSHLNDVDRAYKAALSSPSLPNASPSESTSGDSSSGGP